MNLPTPTLQITQSIHWMLAAGRINIALRITVRVSVVKTQSHMREL